MTDHQRPGVPTRWARLRFAVVGHLLAAPPPLGELQGRLDELAAKRWAHPTTGEPTRFGRSTIERWYYQALNAGADPVADLRKKTRKDRGHQRSLGPKLRAAILSQYSSHRAWSYRLHHDNLVALAPMAPGLGPVPSYVTVKRFMKASGLTKRRRFPDTPGGRAAGDRLDEREVRSYESAYVNGLWHLDFHQGSRRLTTPQGELVTVQLLGIMDDRSRLACHVQWYLEEERSEDLVHGLSQAFQKRQLPRALMTDNGGAMIAAETTEGLARLGIAHDLTLPHSPYQNGKQESFWTQVEGRLLAMLENCRDLTLSLLNEATQAWVELEYNRKEHTETGETPLNRYLAGPDLGRPSLDSAALRLAFGGEVTRTQRRSDGTVSLEGRRFEIPSSYRGSRRSRR